MGTLRLSVCPCHHIQARDTTAPSAVKKWLEKLSRWFVSVQLTRQIHSIESAIKMTDLEIENYLNQHEWSVVPNDFIHDVMNTSPQVTIYYYDSENKLMTIETGKKRFIFHWNIKELYGRSEQ